MRRLRRVRAGVAPGHGVHAKENPRQTAGVLAYSLPVASRVCGFQDYEDREKQNDQHMHVLIYLRFSIVQCRDRVLDQDLRLEQCAALSIEPMLDRVGLALAVACLLQLGRRAKAFRYILVID